MRFLLVVIMFLAYAPVYAQVSTEGSDFWLGFMNNWQQDINNNPVQLEVYISSRDTVEGVLSIPSNPGFPDKHFVVIPDVATIISLPTSIAMAEGSESIEDKGIRIATEGTVSVYAMNKRRWSADISVILPTISLGKNYLVTSHWEPGNRNNGDNSDSEFLVVAIANNTTVEIIPSQRTKSGNPKGVPFRVELDSGQTFQVQARGDLTGTQVYAAGGEDACNNFALFAGNRYTKVGQCDHPDGHDHLYAQMYPTNTWGRAFLTMALKSRQGGDYFKIMAAEDGTEFMINDVLHTLNSTEYLEVTMQGVNSITSNKPINVSQFSRSQACDNSTSDPFTFIVSPKEQLLREVTFYAPPGNNLNFYFLNVLLPTEDVMNITLDGASISGFFNFTPHDSSFMFAQIPIVEGNHTLKSQIGFNAYVYGYGFNESFGFATGASLENLSLEVAVEDVEGIALSEDDICWTTEVVFRPETTRFFNSYTWDFGDGVTVTKSDPVHVNHTYAAPGSYLVSLTASRFDAACAIGGREVSLKEITVTRPEVSILGPRSVCPQTPQVPYVANGDEGTIVAWQWDGGNHRYSDADSLVIDWGGSNDRAYVQALPTSAKGCVGSWETLPVKINVALEPESPFGLDSLCSIDASGVRYSAYATVGSIYSWGIDGGTIVSGDGTPEVDVDWTGAGTKQIWFYQESSLDSICGGGSDTAIVYVEQLPDLNGEIIAPDQVIASEPFELGLAVDPRFGVANWQLNSAPLADSVEIGFRTHAIDCPGTYPIEVLVFDTLGVCKASTRLGRTIEVVYPELNIVHVTNEPGEDSTLYVRWSGDELDRFRQAITLWQYNGTDWLASDSVETAVEEERVADLLTHDRTYTFRMQANNDCPEEFGTGQHTSMVLRTADVTLDDVTMEWNTYAGWENGIDHYEVWLQLDNQAPQKLTETQLSSYFFQDPNDGFDYCFTIKALERDGNRTYSWSNTACVRFIPELTTYNVFSPNGDEWNETFVIDGIEHYPESVLTVVNRYGKQVYEAKGYSNSWNGGDLATGVYFWSLVLNEPRADIEVLNGQVSILK